MDLIKFRSMCGLRKYVCITIFVGVLCGVSLLIGLPAIILGCNDFLCPLQMRVPATVDWSSLTEATCTADGCDSFSDDCFPGMPDTHDCSHWETGLTHKRGSCKVSSGPHVVGSTVTVYIDRIGRDRMCNLEFATMNRLPYVGILFIAIAGLLFFGLIVSASLACVF